MAADVLSRAGSGATRRVCMQRWEFVMVSKRASILAVLPAILLNGFDGLATPVSHEGIYCVIDGQIVYHAPTCLAVRTQPPRIRKIRPVVRQPTVVRRQKAIRKRVDFDEQSADCAACRFDGEAANYFDYGLDPYKGYGYRGMP